MKKPTWATKRADRQIQRTYRQTKNWSATARRHNICVQTAKNAVSRAAKAETT